MARCVVPPASSWMPWPLLGLTPEIACYSHGPDTQVGCCLPPPSPPPLPSFRILLLPFPSADAPSRQADRRTDESRVGADGRGGEGAGVGEAARAHWCSSSHQTTAVGGPPLQCSVENQHAFICCLILVVYQFIRSWCSFAGPPGVPAGGNEDRDKGNRSRVMRHRRVYCGLVPAEGMCCGFIVM